jgi:hypothetical protein
VTHGASATNEILVEIVALLSEERFVVIDNRSRVTSSIDVLDVPVGLGSTISLGSKTSPIRHYRRGHPRHTTSSFVPAATHPPYPTDT